MHILNPAALVFVNAPVYYWNPAVILKNLRTEPGVYLQKYVQAALGKPIPALWQFQRLLSETKPIFKKVNCPVLIIQAKDDDTVHHKSAGFIYEKVSGVKEINKIAKGGHMVFQSSSCLDVCAAVDSFLRRENN